MPVLCSPPRRITLRRLLAVCALLFVAPGHPAAGSRDDQVREIAGAVTLGKALVLSDSEVIAAASQACTHMDQITRVAPEGSPHAERLAAITRPFAAVDGLHLTFKVYLVDEMNAWAMANGCVRVYAGLLDLFTDDEVRAVIGHEIGHVKHGHTKAKMRTALLARGVRQSAAASGGAQVGTIASGELGALTEAVVNAQFSQREERAADDYGLDFMLKHGFDPQAMVTMFRKLPAKKGGLLATHPGTESRAARIEARLKRGR